MQGLSADIIIYFIKYIIMFSLLFIIVPRFIFIYDKNDITKGIVTNYIKIVFCIIVFGYITVTLRLFEFVIMLTFILIGAVNKYYRIHRKNNESGSLGKDINDILNILFINHVDRIERIERKLLSWFDNRTERLHIVIANYFGNAWNVTNTFLIVGVLIYTGYLYLYNSFINIAPSANESFVSFLWMKYIANRIIFADGIYPQGFYIFLETLHKFALMDQVYIINFIGPVNSILLAFGMYFFISRIIKSKIGGIFAVIIFGLCGNMFVNSLPMLTAANPQIFGFVFIFPVLYFYYEYINNSTSDEFLVILLGATLIGLIHPLALVFLCIGLFALCFANVIRDVKNSLYKVFEVFVITLISALLSLIPIGIGLLLGKPFNLEAIQFMQIFTETSTATVLRLFDYFALASIGLVFINLFFVFKNKRLFVAKLWIVIFSLISFSAYYFASLFTNNSYILESSNTLWWLLIPIIIAFGITVILDVIGLVIKSKVVGYLIAIAVLIISLTYPPSPIMTEKIEHGSIVQQYLRISKTFRPTQWMIISSLEGHTLALGNGFYMNIDDFIQNYNPNDEKLIDRSTIDMNELKTEDIFIFNESKNDGAIAEWIVEYQRTHDNISLYSSDESLEVWRIHQVLDKEEIKKRVWQGE